MAALPLQREIEYPESDGRPLGETDWHREEIVDLIYALEQRYRDAPDIYVSGNLLLYYVEGDTSKSICPDVLLVEGVTKEKRPIYKLWVEKCPPSLVIEMASKSTWPEDLANKMAIYARIGVTEYFLFDPVSLYLNPCLQGFRLTRSGYRSIEPARDGSMVSEVTGLRLQLEGQKLRLVDLANGEKLLRASEERAAREAAEAQMVAERSAREAAEEEIRRLRRELDERRSAG